MKLSVRKTIFYSSSLRKYKIKVENRHLDDNILTICFYRKPKFWFFYTMCVSVKQVRFDNSDVVEERASKILRRIEDEIKSIEEHEVLVSSLEKALGEISSVLDRLKD